MQDVMKAVRVLQVYLLVLSLYVLIRCAFIAMIKPGGLAILFYEPRARDMAEAAVICAMICLVIFLRRERWFKVLFLVVIAINCAPILGLASYLLSGAWQRVEFPQYYSRVNMVSVFSFLAIINTLLFLLIYSATSFLTSRSGKAA